MNVTKDVEREIRDLLASDVSSNKISRSADINLSLVSRMRNDKIDLQNVKWFNIKNLYRLSQELKQHN